MPKLAVGAGLARGARAFMESFNQTRQQEQQNKLQKHMFLIKFIEQQLGDDNLPYRKRLQLMNQIPSLLGIKSDMPLSQQMGLDDLMDDEVEVEAGKAATTTKGQTGDNLSNLQNIQGNELEGEVSSGQSSGTPVLSLQGTEATPAKTEQFGNLSPAKYKQLITQRIKDRDRASELEDFRRRAEIDYELRVKALDAQGYNQPVSEGYAEDGSYVLLMSNKSGDIKEVKMPKGFKPLKQIVAETRGSGLPAAVKAYAAYFAGQVNPITGQPYTPEEAQARAVEHYKEHGDAIANLSKAQKEETLTRTKQITSGTQPLSPGETADNARADAALGLSKQTKQIELERDADEAAAITQSLVDESTKLQIERNGIMIRLNKIIADNEGIPTLEDSPEAYKEYTALQARQDRVDDDLRATQGRLTTAQAKAAAAEAAAKKLASSTSTGNVQIQDWQVQRFRQNNARNPKVQQMSDAEIRTILERNRDKWQR